MKRSITHDIRRLLVAGMIAGIAVALAACANPSDQPTNEGRSASTEAEQQHAAIFEDIHRAVAVLRPTEGNDVRGTVTFVDVNDGVQVTADLTGLEPGSTHGFHVHEYGDVTATDGTAAGSHYDPGGHPHALPDERPRHAGDLGNVQADAEGRVHHEVVVENISVAGLYNPVLGRALIVHAQADDGGQPTGNAGARIAQGVIGVAGPEGSGS